MTPDDDGLTPHPYGFVRTWQSRPPAAVLKPSQTMDSTCRLREDRLQSLNPASPPATCVSDNDDIRSVGTSFGQDAGGVRCKGLCWSGREIRRRLTWHAGHRGPVCTAARRWRVEWMNEWMRHIRKTRRSASCVKCFSISTIPARVNMDRLPCGVARQPRYHWLTADLVLMIIRWEKQMQLHYLPQLSNRSSWRHSLPIMAVLRIQERPEIFK